MKHQKGAALIVVLTLLTISLMVGLASMQSSQIDERLAGNYKAQSEVQMGAERAAAAGWSMPPSSVDFQHVSFTLADMMGFGWEEFKEDSIFSDQRLSTNACSENVDCYYRFVKSGGSDYILAMGSIGDGELATSQIVAVEVQLGGGPSPLFNSPIVGCEGVTMGGGSTVGSYDSREGGWDGTAGSFLESSSPLVSTLNGDSADIVLGGNEKIYGSISSYGGVTLNGSSSIHGSVSANQTVNLQGGGAKVKGDVETLGNINFSSSDRVESSLKAGKDIVFGNWSSYVGEAIYAGGSVVTNTNRKDPSEHLFVDNRGNYFPGNSGNPAGVTQQICDNALFGERSFDDERDFLKSVVSPLNSDPEISSNDLLIGPWPNGDWEISSEGVRRFDKTWNINDWVSHGRTQSVENALGREGDVNVMRVGDLRISSSGSLRVTGDVVLIVEGEFSIGGGGQGLVIDPNGSLTVIVEGKTQFGSAAKMNSVNTLNLSGNPSLSILSAYEGSDNGIEFNGGGRVVANVYAPFTGVSVNSGADFYGSVRGQKVTVSGDGLIAYDEALTNTGYTSGGAGAGGNPTISSWQ
ncbi:DUF7305 domain-containing protein [Franzmannia qiaohouensis]|uniref:Type 4 fimbrial biogenesis protein PilX N-terminal domain-containing protein n=1 Tax=Franzmannia qiaohouensis TaxID=1329370 RepID=A0ABU1HI40_9GAMM|nr:PilX N-terminal domain-containing pilus assembly protein [Halomonas qiaohouensis]MDR5907153.1 hypothetical protein [Halomonas qiaohouensis]